MLSRWGGLESDSEGSERSSERGVDFLTVTVYCGNTMLVRIVCGSDGVLDCLEHGSSGFGFCAEY